ncbi:MAG: uracil-DNA glycosylase family protein, partial [Candidatus Thermoplasmatota archaeon]|nr:uracil-DNA glycosylase family protein [Candidatus Thermoplasmatota archaeon]
CNRGKNRILKHKSVAHVTNPLDYAWEFHEQFIDTWSGFGATTLLLGMNPGPYGMAQTGVPFGATAMARDILQIEERDVQTPLGAHPKRPIEGLSMGRQEVSGTRFWSMLSDHYGSTEAIFSNIFVVNHCPLLILGETGRNVTPVDLPKSTIEPVLKACDRHLKSVVDIMGIETVVGVGNYAKKRAQSVLTDIHIDAMWHPSPASPLANRNGGADWRANAISKIP